MFLLAYLSGPSHTQKNHGSGEEQEREDGEERGDSVATSSHCTREDCLPATRDNRQDNNMECNIFMWLSTPTLRAASVPHSPHLNCLRVRKLCHNCLSSSLLGFSYFHGIMFHRK